MASRRFVVGHTAGILALVLFTHLSLYRLCSIPSALLRCSVPSSLSALFVGRRSVGRVDAPRTEELDGRDQEVYMRVHVRREWNARHEETECAIRDSDIFHLVNNGVTVIANITISSIFDLVLQYAIDLSSDGFSTSFPLLRFPLFASHRSARFH